MNLKKYERGSRNALSSYFKVSTVPKEQKNLWCVLATLFEVTPGVLEHKTAHHVQLGIGADLESQVLVYAPPAITVTFFPKTTLMDGSDPNRVPCIPTEAPRGQVVRVNAFPAHPDLTAIAQGLWTIPTIFAHPGSGAPDTGRQFSVLQAENGCCLVLPNPVNASLVLEGLIARTLRPQGSPMWRGSHAGLLTNALWVLSRRNYAELDPTANHRQPSLKFARQVTCVQRGRHLTISPNNFVHFPSTAQPILLP
ncbi:uncharacterized protein LOC144200598 [Stigmatopora nigra]